MRNWKRRFTLIALMMLSSARCATAPSEAPTDPRLVCPALVEYDRATLERGADEFHALPPGSVLRRYIDDYFVLRKVVEGCQR